MLPGLGPLFILGNASIDINRIDSLLNKLALCCWVFLRFFGLLVYMLITIIALLSEFEYVTSSKFHGIVSMPSRRSWMRSSVQDQAGASLVGSALSVSGEP
jgi:hypothetical protein